MVALFIAFDTVICRLSIQHTHYTFGAIVSTLNNTYKLLSDLLLIFIVKKYEYTSFLWRFNFYILNINLIQRVKNIT